MYQMLTGSLPYNTPSPADLDRLMRGELVVSPRLKNSRIPTAISDIVLKALDADMTTRYQSAAGLLEDVLAARESPPGRARSRRGASTAPSGDAPSRARSLRAASKDEESVSDIQQRLRARETPQPRFCWNCRKPLSARAERCPFCREAQ
jgi:serine/threonine protein kinase